VIEGYKYKSPEMLLEELGIALPEEVDIEAIAQYCDATVVYKPLYGCEGRVLGFNNRAIITVNSNSSRVRQRFSAAHELGHWMCDRGQIAFSCTEKMFHENWFRKDKEASANRYAVDLLLPENMFVDMVRNKEITFYTVRETAKAFRTSMTATAIRLVELGSYPAMVICCGRERRKWFKRGPDVNEKIWPCETLDKDSVAYDLLFNDSTIVEPVDVYASVWINHPEADRYEIREHSIKISQDLVLTILWWKDEKQLLDLEED